MPDIIQREHLDTDPIECVREQIKTADTERQAVSRFGLAEIVSERTGMPLEQAKLLVEAYCDENAAHVPAYLNQEFSLFWPKVLAFIFAIAGVSALWYAAGLARARKPAWLWLAIGTVIIGVAVFQWVRSLESYQRRAARKREDNKKRLRDTYAKPR